MLIDLYAELFPKSFVDHVKRLESDMHYRDMFAAMIRNMPYEDWLQTPKWKLTAKLKLQTNRKCECGESKNLEVHHIHYQHLGIEVLHLSDLLVLCRYCHQRVHTINGKPQMRFAFSCDPRSFSCEPRIYSRS